MKTIDEAVNYAAGELPKHHNIDINIENGGYGVYLNYPDGSQDAMTEQSIIDDIIVATDTAKNSAV